ncbi:MAG: hypothetical protein Q9M26_07540 [Mariprofundales bacterium]|nr:hypothetical protein [Mariprofundales bacterium]
MSFNRYGAALEICQQHAKRLRWAMEQMQPKQPFTVATLNNLTDMELAVVDQLLTRFAKLQDTMGASLFPAVLELTKEQGDLHAFIDKLHRLEKIGAIDSSDGWLLLREMRNSYAHEYPDDPVLQAAQMNKFLTLAASLLTTFKRVEKFANRYAQ